MLASSLFMHVSGQDPAKALLRSLNAHSLLFTGPEKVGRRQTARWFTALLNCQNQPAPEPCQLCQSCKLMLANEHPDYKEIQPDLSTSTGRLNKRPEIRISQLVFRKGSTDEALSQWLESRASFKIKVAVIDSAHLLNLSAANAFLKTLEEPPSHTRIILIAPSQQAVLPTIASRATVVRFSPSKDLQTKPFALARLGRFGDSESTATNPALETQAALIESIESFISKLKGNLEEAFEAADALEKIWESSPDAGELVLARLSQEKPERYQKASEALESFEHALASYSSSHLAMQVLALDLRACLR